MRILSSFVKAVVAVALLRGGGSGVVATDAEYSDTCAEVNAELKVPQPLIPKNLIGVGIISEWSPMWTRPWCCVG